MDGCLIFDTKVYLNAIIVTKTSKLDFLCSYIPSLLDINISIFTAILYLLSLLVLKTNTFVISASKC